LPDRNLFFHLILAGGTEVRRGEELVTTLAPGQYFGELSLIDGGPRTADVIAGPDGATTFALPDGAFQRLLAEHPEIAVPMLRVLAARIRGD
jgi:CRP-like cAMP-binding protein